MNDSIPHLDEPGVTINSYVEDEHETRMNAALRPWDRKSTPDIGFLGVPYDGASVVRNGSRHAPDQIRQSFYYNTTYSPDLDTDISVLDLADLGDVDVDLMDLRRTQRRTVDVLSEVYDRGIVPIAVGGDHSISKATVEAACAREDVDSLGLIQFDAHQDLRHSHADQPSSGVQFRELLEDPDRPEFTGDAYAQVGIRGFMNSREYLDYAHENGVSVFTGWDVKNRGIDDIVTDALEVTADGTDAIFVTVDVDCLDIGVAPGTAAPSPGGLTSREILSALYSVGRHEKTIGLDLVEISPPHDVNDVTSITGATMLLYFLGGLAERKR